MNEAELVAFEHLDAVYRSLCAMLYNYAPLSGHPGGSISSGRFVSTLLFDTMDYDFSNPSRDDADSIVYAAGHKALGLYAMWALRNEIVRIGRPELLPDPGKQLRLEDLLGFRRNPRNATPLFAQFGSRALDGHPTPATPFVRVATGASGVGMGSALGYALAALDYYGDDAPRVHIVEGEGGLTPGRVAEALAFAGTGSLRNAIVHVDWNQSSIDSDRVTREGDQRGDYVQWDPMSLFRLHDWNVIYVDEGIDFHAIAEAQQQALAFDNGQPTAIVYRTTKGWQYGVEGRASHGAGHKLCSPGFFDALELSGQLPSCPPNAQQCAKGTNATVLEQCFWDALSIVRESLERQSATMRLLADRIVDAKSRLDAAKRTPRDGAPVVDDVYALTQVVSPPPELALQPGADIALRTQLGRVLGYLNRFSGGALLIAAADLLGSTSIAEAAKDFDGGFFGASNRDSRTLSVGGICEDAMSAILSGVSAFGRHIGAGSSYGAFLAPLGHIAARLHAIGDASRSAGPLTRDGRVGEPDPRRPMILICGHAGLKTGEDGPTHADPQPLQLLQENFPPGAMITLTPWEPNEIWPLMSAALSKRPSVIAPFVTRPNETIVDRAALGLAPAEAAVTGVYKLRAARGVADATVVLQESGVTYAFITGALPRLLEAGVDVEVFYIASAELFHHLSPSEQEAIFPSEAAARAIGITGFTMPTMYRWITSPRGRALTMHPFMHGRYPGSGPGRAVIAEAGLDGDAQFTRIMEMVGEKTCR